MLRVYSLRWMLKYFSVIVTAFAVASIFRSNEQIECSALRHVCFNVLGGIQSGATFKQTESYSVVSLTTKLD